MTKVGIELPDYKIYDVDLSRPELGNPGVGGSEFLFALLANELCLKEIDIIVYHYCENKLSPSINCRIVKDSIEMLQNAEQDGIDILIHQIGKTKEWYDYLDTTNLKSIAWAHVFLEYYELKLIRNCTNVKRVVFVGKEEYDSYIDDDIIKKATYIYNMIPTGKCPPERVISNLEVTYVGSLVPAKGFHKLAEIWPEIIKNAPNAKLNIIGNGKIYDRSAELGRFGIAQSDYESKFMKYLLDENGNIHSSVRFWGIVGTEKKDIFKRTTVGIVNPTALTETFCMSAVEMEFAFIPVISKKKWGLLDTIKDNQTGFLFKNKSEFIKRLLFLINNPQFNNDMGEKAHNYVKENFSVDVILPKWEKLIEAVDKELPAKYHPVQENWTNDFKWIKQCIRILRFKLNLRKIPSFYDIKNFIKIHLKGN